MRNMEMSQLLDRYMPLAESPHNLELLRQTWLHPSLAYFLQAFKSIEEDMASTSCRV